MEKIRILVVEDDTDLRETICMALNEHSYVTSEAADGIEAFNLLYAPGPKPDLILLDVMMPRMDGMAFLAGIRQSEMCNIPIILMTAANEKTIKISSSARNLTPILPDERLAKPINFETLFGTIVRILAK